ncbi:hypothetical protein GCM10007916_04840 [Psychromonas marina]|uniref:Flagellar hook-associated protein 2 n=1 Tax=Psychromonas marina TaxID=88364 RepID=A0ABQ6DW98_9GAMM|nr:flagellar filament capping protein FliD [Psychromonas marina]GLS89417.1 hypothetical protein GCM10007916_04840 [Psychromonas marina]
MSSITSTGMGSGLDINGIVTAMVNAEKDPATAKIMKASADATAQISAYGMLNSELSEFKSSYSDLGYNSTFSAANASTSDDEILDATLGIGAATGTWEFEVKQRAQAHTLITSAADNIEDVNEPIGTGVISFRFGSYSDVDGSFSVDPNKPVESLTIDSSNNSLTLMRDTINDKENNYSVSASIINDGTNYRLVLTSKETGETSAIEMTVADEDGGLVDDGVGLSRFTYSETNKSLQQTAAAQDALIDMNGIDISSSSNEVTNVIEGVTLNLYGETEVGKKVTLRINQDTTKVQEQIEAFVENYNSTISKMNELTAAGGTGSDGGILNGDSTVRSIREQMRSVLNTQVSHIEGSVRSFSDLGMLTERDGTLTLDAAKFAEVLKSDMPSVAEFFTASGGSTDPQISFDSNNSLTKPGSYPVEVTQLATQGTLTGADISGLTFPFTINDDNDSFTMRVDGYLSGDINLRQKSYASIEDLATEMQSQINSDSNFVENKIKVSVVNDLGSLTVNSNRYGERSTVAFTQVDSDFLSDLGFDVSGGVNGINAAGTIDGKPAYADGQYLLSEEGDSTGMKLLIEGGALGPRGEVTYAEGLTKIMNNVLDGIIDLNISDSIGDVESSDGMIDSKVDSLYKKIWSEEDKLETLNYRMDKLEARLFKSFNAMDMAVSNLNSTREYLKSTLDALPGYTRDN